MLSRRFVLTRSNNTTSASLARHVPLLSSSRRHQAGMGSGSSGTSTSFPNSPQDGAKHSDIGMAIPFLFLGFCLWASYELMPSNAAAPPKPRIISSTMIPLEEDDPNIIVVGSKKNDGQ